MVRELQQPMTSLTTAHFEPDKDDYEQYLKAQIQDANYHHERQAAPNDLLLGHIQGLSLALELYKLFKAGTPLFPEVEEHRMFKLGDGDFKLYIRHQSEDESEDSHE